MNHSKHTQYVLKMVPTFSYRCHFAKFTIRKKIKVNILPWVRMWA